MKQKENQRLKFVTISTINIKKDTENQHLRQCQKLKNEETPRFHSLFLNKFFQVYFSLLITLYITLGKEGTQCKHITTMIKLSITRIAVIGINYSFLWFKRTINYFLSVLSIFYTLINTVKNCQKLINNCSSYFNILTTHPKSHI